jgi:hypothetical protein
MVRYRREGREKKESMGQTNFEVGDEDKRNPCGVSE